MKSIVFPLLTIVTLIPRSGATFVGYSGEYIGSTTTAGYPRLAQDLCQQQYGTSLATILSSQDNGNAKAECTQSQKRCWIGLNNTDPTGVGNDFYWMSDDTKSIIDPPDYINWKNGQPDSTPETGAIFAGNGGKWADLGDPNEQNPNNQRVVCDAPQETETCEFRPGNKWAWTQAEAQAKCQSEYGTDLATITSQAANWEAIAVCEDPDHRCWIGYNYSVSTSSWYWISDPAMTVAYTNWKPGMPGSPPNDGTIIDTDGYWEDVTSEKLRYICNAPITTTSAGGAPMGVGGESTGDSGTTTLPWQAVLFCLAGAVVLCVVVSAVYYTRKAKAAESQSKEIELEVAQDVGQPDQTAETSDVV